MNIFRLTYTTNMTNLPDSVIPDQRLELLTFGIARDIIGHAEVTLELNEAVTTVAQLKSLLIVRYPALATLGSFRLAVNEAFAEENDAVRAGDEVAIIPPVSGG